MGNAEQIERFEALLRPVAARAQATARRLSGSQADGDDLFQEAALRAMQRLDTLRDESAFGGWFYRVLVSVHRSRTRVQFWRRLVSFDVVGESIIPNQDAPQEQWLSNQSGASRMRRALMTLPAKQREAVVLADLDGYSIREIAEFQRSSVPAVKSRLSRGRAQLRQFYRKLSASDRLFEAAAFPGASGEVK